MVISRYNENEFLVGCESEFLLENLQRYMDGRKVRKKRQIIIPIKAAPKIMNFVDEVGGIQNIHFKDDTKEVISSVAQNVIERKRRVGKIKEMYKTPEKIYFDYDYRGKYPDIMAHQKVMYNMVRYTDCCALIADPGTCKTGPYLWAIDAKIQKGLVKKCLIITLSTLKHNVIDEMKVQVPHLRGVVLGNKSQSDNVLNKKYKVSKKNMDYDIYIASYEQMYARVEFFDDDYFQMVVLDEAHRVGSPDSRQTQEIVGKFVNTKYKYIVTGTLNANNLMSFYMPFRFLGADTVPLSKYQAFREEYMRSVDKNRYVWIPRKGSKEKVARIIGDISVQFKKEECLDLPECVEPSLYCDMAPKQAKLYKELETDLISTMSDMCSMCNKYNNGCDQMCPDEIVAKNALTLSGKLHQVASGYYMNTVSEIDDDGKEVKKKNTIFLPENPKIKLMMQSISDTPADRKIILWAIHKPLVKLIQDAVSQGYGKDSFITCDGDSKVDPLLQVKQFQSDDNKKFFIGSLQKAGTGLNIQFSSYSIFVQNSYSYLIRDQALGRQHRKGQQNVVTATSLITRGTIDEKVMTAIQNKKDLDITLSYWAKV
jgi:SNF2 family DNA or RNA helicase